MKTLKKERKIKREKKLRSIYTFLILLLIIPESALNSFMKRVCVYERERMGESMS